MNQDINPTLSNSEEPIMEQRITGDNRLYFNSEFVSKPLSNFQRKKMSAQEHNSAYAAGELNRPVDLKEVVREVTMSVLGKKAVTE